MFLVSVLALLLNFPLQAHAVEGLDLNFGKKGVVRDHFGLKNPKAQVMAQDSHGNTWLAGIAGSEKKHEVFLLGLTPEGNLNPKFGSGGLALLDFSGSHGDNAVHGLGIKLSGEIILAGHYRSGAGSGLAVASVNPDGSLNISFGDKGILRQDLGGREELHYLAIGPNGKIWVVGFLAWGNRSDFLAGRLNPDGSLDSQFGNKGWTLTDLGSGDFFYGAALQADGKLVAVGSTDMRDGQEGCAALRYQTDGRLDPLFADHGAALLPFGDKQDVCSSVALMENGKILVAGYATQSKGNTDFLLAQLSESGKLNLNFGKGGRILTDFEGRIDVAHAIAVGSEKIFLGGEFEASAAGYSGFALAVYPLRTAGRADKLSIPLDPHSNTSATTLWLQKDQKALLAGFNGKNLAVVRTHLIDK